MTKRVSYIGGLSKHFESEFGAFLYCHAERGRYKVCIPFAAPYGLFDEASGLTSIHVNPNVKYNLRVFGSPLESATTKIMADEKDHYKLLITPPDAIADDYLTFLFILSFGDAARHCYHQDCDLVSDLRYPNILSILDDDARLVIARLADAYVPLLFNIIMEHAIASSMSDDTSHITPLELIGNPNRDLLQFSTEPATIMLFGRFLRILSQFFALSAKMDRICAMVCMRKGDTSADKIAIVQAVVGRLLHYFPHSLRDLAGCGVEFFTTLLGDDEDCLKTVALWCKDKSEGEAELLELERRHLHLDIEIHRPDGKKHIRIPDVAQKMKVYLSEADLLDCGKVIVNEYDICRGHHPATITVDIKGKPVSIKWYTRWDYDIIAAGIQRYLQTKT